MDTVLGLCRTFPVVVGEKDLIEVVEVLKGLHGLSTWIVAVVAQVDVGHGAIYIWTKEKDQSDFPTNKTKFMTTLSEYSIP